MTDIARDPRELINSMEKVSAYFRDLTEFENDIPVPGEKYSINQILWRMFDFEKFHLIPAVKDILASDCPELGDLEADNIEFDEKANGEDSLYLLTDWEMLRRVTSEFFKEIDEDLWGRIGTMKTGEKISISGLFDLLLKTDQKHFELMIDGLKKLGIR